MNLFLLCASSAIGAIGPRSLQGSVVDEILPLGAVDHHRDPFGNRDTAYSGLAFHSSAKSNRPFGTFGFKMPTPA